MGAPPSWRKQAGSPILCNLLATQRYARVERKRGRLKPGTLSSQTRPHMGTRRSTTCVSVSTSIRPRHSNPDSHSLPTRDHRKHRLNVQLTTDSARHIHDHVYTPIYDRPHEPPNGNHPQCEDPPYYDCIHRYTAVLLCVDHSTISITHSVLDDVPGKPNPHHSTHA
ncbi:MAG: hypothetical protein QG615_254 [Nitrospirota bacterium]|jgi:hypothetical protein|nr:hypothetical protein [Nitrospirota bacterium]